MNAFARACRVGAWLGACAAWLISSAPAPAAACSGPYCVEAEFFPARGTVPANLPAVLFWPLASWDLDDGGAGPDSVEPGDVRFVRLEPSGPVDVAFELVPSDEPSTRRWAGSHGAPAYRIVSDAELQPGARYALWARDCQGELAAELPAASDVDADEGDDGPPRRYALFDVAAAAVLPTSLGSVTIADAAQREVTLGGGSGCYDAFQAMSVIAEVPRGDEPFFDAIAFTTYVDGEVYRPSPHLNYAPAYGGSWVGFGRDELAAICENQYASGSLDFGQHSLRFEGRVAGSDDVLVTTTVDFELPRCAVSVDDAGVDGGAQALDGGARSDAGPSGRDSGTDAAAPDAAGEPHAQDEGCGGCATSGDARGTALPVLLVLGFLRARARRARQQARRAR